MCSTGHRHEDDHRAGSIPSSSIGVKAELNVLKDDPKSPIDRQSRTFEKLGFQRPGTVVGSEPTRLRPKRPGLPTRIRAFPGRDLSRAVAQRKELGFRQLVFGHTGFCVEPGVSAGLSGPRSPTGKTKTNAGSKLASRLEHWLFRAP